MAEQEFESSISLRPNAISRRAQHQQHRLIFACSFDPQNWHFLFLMEEETEAHSHTMPHLHRAPLCVPSSPGQLKEGSPSRPNPWSLEKDLPRSLKRTSLPTCPHCPNCFLKSFLLNYQSVMEESMRVAAELQGQGLLDGGKQSPKGSLG